MSSYDYNLRLQALRQTTAIVAVVGMAASGKSEFDKVVVDKGYPKFAYDYQGIMQDTDLPSSALETFSPARQAEILGLEGNELIAALLQDYNLYAVAKNAMFDIHMNMIAENIRIACADAPDLKSKEVIFVQCPLSTKFKYNDIFDAVITINRPQTYNEASWWVDYYTDGMAANFNNESSVLALKHDDVFFNEIKFTEKVVIDNNQTLESFVAACENTIDQVVEVLQLR